MLPPSRRRPHNLFPRSADEDGKTTVFDRTGESRAASVRGGADERPTVLNSTGQLGIYMPDEVSAGAHGAPPAFYAEDEEGATRLIPSKSLEVPAAVPSRGAMPSYDLEVADEMPAGSMRRSSVPPPRASSPAPRMPTPDRASFRQLIEQDIPRITPAAGTPAMPDPPTEPVSFAPLSPARIQAQIEAARQARLRTRSDVPAAMSPMVMQPAPPPQMSNSGPWPVPPPSYPSAWPSAAVSTRSLPATAESSSRFEAPPMAVSTAFQSEKPAGRSGVWAIALSAMAVFGLVATVAIVQGKGDELIRTGAAFVDPSMLQTPSQPPAPAAQPAPAPQAAPAPVAQNPAPGLDTSVVTAHPAATVVSAAAPVMVSGNKEALTAMADKAAKPAPPPAPKPAFFAEKAPEKPVEKADKADKADKNERTEKTEKTQVAEKPRPAAPKPAVVAAAPKPAPVAKVDDSKTEKTPKKKTDDADSAAAARADALARAQLEQSL